MTADTGKPRIPRAESELLAAVREAARQEQFLEVVSADEARSRFERNLDLAPLPGERVTLAAALGRVLAHDLAAPIDVPPFDRANVDGFALRSADSAGATDASPKQIALNAEVIACGHAPNIEVRPGTATLGCRTTSMAANPHAASMPISREPITWPFRIRASPRAMSEPA